MFANNFQYLGKRVGRGYGGWLGGVELDLIQDNGNDAWSLALKDMHLIQSTPLKFSLFFPPQQLMSFAGLKGTPGL